MFGLVAATAGLAAAIGPPLAGELVAQWDWRAIFTVSLPLVAVSLVLARGIDSNRAAHPSWRAVGADFDWGGVVLLALGFGALIAATRLDDPARIAAAAYGASTLVLFVLWELRHADPIVRPALFANRVFGAGCAIVALQTLAMYGLPLQLPIFFSQHRTSSPRAIGLMLLVMFVALFAASIAGGRIGDWLGAGRTALAGAVGLSGLLCALLPGRTSTISPSHAPP
ncbi:MAG: MFS transporter [Myxococcales bacterium]|nr:MFS transporter [Myxococcales bacterium]